MRIFVSSVRVGLEQERDSLRGFIMALGHEPVMFEDFSAQPVPSRQACLEGVRSCDAYLLILGERYGYTFSETDLSPTAEEYVAARTKGILRVVMRKAGVTPEPKQAALIEEIGSYRDGVFYNEFVDVADLQTKVAAAVRQLEQAPGPLQFAPLPDGVTVQWRGDWPQPQQSRAERSVLELHVIPAVPQPVPGRVLRDLPGRLASELRAAAGVGPSAAVPAEHDATAAWAHVAEPPNSWRYDEPRDGTIVGCRVAATGQTSAWSTLPGDAMGSILDQDDLNDRLARLLRTVGAVLPGDAQHLVLAVGLEPLGMLSEGRVTGVPRRRMSPIGSSTERLIVPPDEAVTRAAVGHGSREAASGLAAAVLTALRSNRGEAWH